MRTEAETGEKQLHSLEHPKLKATARSQKEVRRDSTQSHRATMVLPTP